MKSLLLKLFLSFVVLFEFAVASENFTIMAEDLPPFVYTNPDTKEPAGIAVRIVQEMSKKMKHSQKVDIMSWNRAYNLIVKNDGYALFPVSRRPNREELFTWVGPLLKSTSYFYKRKDSSLSINSFEDAKKVKTIGVVKNYAGHQLLEKEGFENVIAVGHTKDVIRALVYKRADLVEVGDVFLPFRSKQADVDYKLLENTNVKLLEQYQYLAFSKDTPKSIVENWQKTLDRMKADGTYDKISKEEFKKALQVFHLE